MQIQHFIFNPFQENTYIVFDSTNECIIIDPGCYTKEEKDILKKFIKTNKLTPVKLINTHCHIDHILGNKYITEKWNLDLIIHKKDLSLLKESKNISNLYGFSDYQLSPNPSIFMSNYQIITFGNQELKVLHTPGHSPGHICLYNQKKNMLIAGDLIFKGSVGRTDLPGGNYEHLLNSIKKQILTLPNKTKIFCGHGPSTTLEEEKKNNPYLML